MKRTPESHFQFDEEDNDDFLAEVAAVEAHLLSHSKRFKSSAAPPANTSSAIATLNYSKGSNQEPQGAYLAALRGNVTPRQLMEQQRKNSTSVPSRFVANGSRLKVLTADAGAGGDQSGSGADDACFKCGKSGHWARDCDSARVGDGLPESSVPEKACPCGEGICSVLTANTERNKGRRFYRCPVRQEMGGCTFFEWCDSSSGVTMANTNYSKNVNTFPDLACPCGAGSCLILTAKTGNNAGQQFYRCPANQGNSCGFFKWCNEQIATGGLSVSAKQAYGSASGGSSFNGTNSSYGGKGGSSCFKCGKEGHWARDCSAPSEPSSGYTMKPNSSSGTCYKCGKPGHWAKECPNH